MSCSRSSASSSASSVSLSQMKRPAKATSGTMTVTARSTTSKSTSSLMSLIPKTSDRFLCVAANGSAKGNAGPHPERGMCLSAASRSASSSLLTLRDHRVDLLTSELDENMAQSGPHLHQQAHHELMILLEEENVAWLLLVDVAAKDPERGLVEPRCLS